MMELLTVNKGSRSPEEERETQKLIAEGKSDREIAQIMNRTTAATKAYRLKHAKVHRPRYSTGQKPSFTLCWKCQNSVPKRNRGCAWSKSGGKMPVDGSIMDGGTVVECPEYLPD